jgi:hypothetical protein
MTDHYSDWERFALSIDYLLASDPLVWYRWDCLERRLGTRR